MYWLCVEFRRLNGSVSVKYWPIRDVPVRRSGSLFVDLLCGFSRTQSRTGLGIERSIVRTVVTQRAYKFVHNMHILFILCTNYSHMHLFYAYDMHTTCIQHAYNMHTTCTQQPTPTYVFNMRTFLQHACTMHTSYIQHAHNMHTTCTQHAYTNNSHVYTTCMRYAYTASEPLALCWSVLNSSAEFRPVLHELWSAPVIQTFV